MIPAQRTGAHDEPGRPVFHMTVTDPGCTDAGPGFRTHNATVHITTEPAATPLADRSTPCTPRS